jgi:UDP-2-acetamido-2-deoxy-ribo-hexuluronate aminotransferase
MQFIDLKAQYASLKDPIQQRINAVLEHGQYVMGPEIEELEERLAKFVGTEHCMCVSSGTDALLVALMALEIGQGDEVITTPFSFIATAEMIALTGAKPVFVDIDPRTYNMNPLLIEKAITTNTRAIMPVSLYGQCAAFDEINKIASAHSLAVIEDAAQSFGATYRGRRSCSLSTIACTSFFPSKPLGCYGDGGACFTDDDQLAQRIREIRIHGQDGRYNHPVLGINGRMDSIQAAVLLAKLDSFASEVAVRRRLGEAYDREFIKRCSEIVVPYIDSHNTSVFAQYTIEVDERSRVQENLSDAGIPTAIHYPIPLSLQPAFAQLGYEKGNFPIAEAAAARVLSLPMHPFLSDADLERVANAVSLAVNLNRKPNANTKTT